MDYRQVILDHEITPREMHALCYDGMDEMDDAQFDAVIEEENKHYFSGPALSVEDDSYRGEFLVYVEGYDIMDYFVVLHESSYPEMGVRREGNTTIQYAIGKRHGYRVVFDQNSDMGNMSDVMHFLSRRMSSQPEILFHTQAQPPVPLDAHDEWVAERHAQWLKKWEDAGKYKTDPRIL